MPPLVIGPGSDAGFSSVEFTWRETEPEHPAADVLVRLIGVTDYAQDDGQLDPFLLAPGSGTEWTGVIRLPSDLRTTYQLCIVRDQPIRGQRLDDDRWTEVMGMGIPDPTNPVELGPCTFGNPGMASVLALPAALPQPWVTRRDGVSRGELHRHEMGTGDDASVVHLYTPAGHDDGSSEPLPLVVVFDAGWWTIVGVETTFDNLIADRVVGPFAAALVESIHGLHRVQSYPRPDVVLPFLLDELLPFVSSELNVTDDPRRTVFAGQSLGGLAGMNVALEAPNRFGLVLCQSGSLWWAGDDEGELGGAELMARYAEHARVPVRFFLEAGSNERDLLDSNRDLRDVLAERGYDVTYREYQGGHDYACWRGGLADGLVALLGANPG